MTDVIFDDKNKVPSDADLHEALGTTKKLWDELKDYIKDNYDSVREEWKIYEKKYGWHLKLISKKRNMMFLVPRKGNFVVGFLFSEKAVKAIEDSTLDQKIITEVKEAKKFIIGRNLGIEVKSEKDIDNIKKLAEIKMNN